MKFRYRLIFFIIGLVGLGIMVWQSDVTHIDWNTLLTPNALLFLLGLLGLWLCIYILHTLCYYVILGEERRKVPFLSLLKICASGFALNSVTPAGLVGGEPYRIIALKKYCSTEKASSATLTFSLFYIMGHVAMWMAGSIVFLASGFSVRSALGVILIITTIVTAGILVAFLLSKKHGLVRPFMHFLTKVPLLKKLMIKVYEKNEASYVEIDENIKAFRATRLRFWTVFALQFLSRILECVEYYLIFLFLGQSINFFGGVILLTTASLIGNLLFLIPMQAGTREGGMIMALSFLAIEASVGVVGALIYRIRDLVCILIGISMILFDKKKKTAETPLPAVEDVSPAALEGEALPTDPTGEVPNEAQESSSKEITEEISETKTEDPNEDSED